MLFIEINDSFDKVFILLIGLIIEKREINKKTDVVIIIPINANK